MGYRVAIDKDACQSSGNCVHEAPAAFVFDEDDLGEATADARELSRERLIAIARRCPAIAISIFEPDGGKVDLYS